MKTLIAVFEPELKQIIFPAQTIDRLKQFSQVDVVEEERPLSSHDLAEVIGEYDALLTSWRSPKVTQGVLDQARRLKFIGHAAGSVTGIIEPGVLEKGITVVNANYALARSTAELALVLMLAGAWDIRGYVNRLEGNGWSNNMTETVMGLHKQTIGLIGLGEISRELILLLQPFQPEILLYSSYCDQEEAERLGVTLCELEELLRRSSVISVHSTLTATTKGMLGTRELSWIRDGALLVNTARAQLIDESALHKELEQGRIRAALDVFDTEPLPAGHNLRSLPNVLSTPHIGGYSRYWKTKLGELVIEDLERFILGEMPHRLVTEQMLGRMTVNKL